MPAEKKLWIKFKSNTPIPANVLGEDEDRRAQSGKPIQLPASYAKHVVSDGFAEFCEEPKKKGAVVPVKAEA